jgi:hypothetical protein
VDDDRGFKLSHYASHSGLRLELIGVHTKAAGLRVEVEEGLLESKIWRFDVKRLEAARDSEEI